VVGSVCPEHSVARTRAGRPSCGRLIFTLCQIGDDPSGDDQFDGTFEFIDATAISGKFAVQKEPIVGRAFVRAANQIPADGGIGKDDVGCVCCGLPKHRPSPLGGRNPRRMGTVFDTRPRLSVIAITEMTAVTLLLHCYLQPFYIERLY